MAYTREETPAKTKEQAKGSTEDQETNEWEELLSRSMYWRMLRITAWVLRLKTNCPAKLNKVKKKSGPLFTEELAKAKQHGWKEHKEEYLMAWKDLMEISQG